MDQKARHTGWGLQKRKNRGRKEEACIPFDGHGGSLLKQQHHRLCANLYKRQCRLHMTAMIDPCQPPDVLILIMTSEVMRRSAHCTMQFERPVP